MCGCFPSCNVGLNLSWGTGSNNNIRPGANSGPSVITTQPVGSGTAATITAVSDVAARILNSQKTEKGAQACYESCSVGCGAPCGCPSCGCSDGQCGCGSVGKSCCHCWDLFCLGGKGSNRDQTRRLILELEETYGPVSLLLAEDEEGVSLETKMQTGEPTTRDERSKLREACQRIAGSLKSRLMQSHLDAWYDRQQNCCGILSGVPGMSEAIELGCRINFPQTFDPSLLLINPEEGRVASNFDLKAISEILVSLNVSSQNSSSSESLGLIPAAGVLQILMNILHCFCKSGNRNWLTASEIQSLIVLIVSIKGYGLVNSKGDVGDAALVQNTDLGRRCMCSCAEGVGVRGLGGLLNSEPQDDLDGGVNDNLISNTDPNGLMDLCRSLKRSEGDSSMTPEEQWSLLKTSEKTVRDLMQSGVEDTRV